MSNRTIKTFVLRAGRMTESQKRGYEDFSPRWCIPFALSPLNFADVFGNANPIIAEIGFGMGSATAQIAEENPHINYLGIEVHRPGVGRLLGEIHRRNLQNLFIIEHDALEVFEYMLGENSLDGVHIFFPDPWQKKKHHKRRLLTKPRIDLLSSRIAAGGYLYFVTDWVPYAEFALAELNQIDCLTNKYDTFAPHQTWRPETKFERRGRTAEREIRELLFVKERV